MSKLRQSARGRMCQVRIAGCLHSPETVVLAHANGSAAGKGIGMKAPDAIAAFCCAYCHDCYDGRRLPPDGWTRDDVHLAFADGVFRTQRIWLEEGLLRVADARSPLDSPKGT